MTVHEIMPLGSPGGSTLQWGARRGLLTHLLLTCQNKDDLSWKAAVEERQRQRQTLIERFCSRPKVQQYKKPEIQRGNSAPFTLFSHQFKYVSLIQIC